MPKKKEEVKYIRVKCVNKMKVLGKDKSIDVCNADGKGFRIKDGEIVELNEYMFNSLNDAREPIYAMEKPPINTSDPEKSEPAKLVQVGTHINVDMTVIEDWYTKDDDGTHIPVKIEDVA
jgi:hypothetical protein